MNVPKVSRMVLFKHGVAFLERGGPADGPFELSFKKSEMNDVLKSLSVWVARGAAKVGAIGFEKPADPEQALAEKRLLFDPGQTLTGLVGATRGRRVSVVSGGRVYRGEVVGIELSSGKDGEEARTLVLAVGDGKVELVDLRLASELVLEDPVARAGLELVTDRQRAATAGDGRAVRVDLSGPAEDVRVSYVIPAPAWRVSYRIAREGDDAVVMGWGLVHNPADEDLGAIELVLTTGQPVSFVIDLYNPKEVARTVVEEQSRVAAAPTRFERAPELRGKMIAMAGPPMPASAPAPAPMGFGPPPMQALAMADAFTAAENASDYADRGELFEYRVAEKVSLKRGGSAMVPLFASKIPAARERIWRTGSPPAPDLVLRFENTTGAVLEEGPAVIYDEGVYAGESMVPYSARGAEVKLGFAKDLGVRCKATSTSRRVTHGVTVKRTGLWLETRVEVHHELVAESDHADEAVVVFELPKIHGRWFDPAGPKPFEDTLSFVRFRATVPARSRATLSPVEVWLESSVLAYESLSDASLGPWQADGLLDPSRGDALRAILDAWRRVAELDRDRKRAEQAKRDAYEKQKRISEQLGVLKDGGAEGALRLRYVSELSAEQDRVNACDAEMVRLTAEIDQARREASERLYAVAPE
jgi:hypothetical protein